MGQGSSHGAGCGACGQQSADEEMYEKNFMIADRVALDPSSEIMSPSTPDDTGRGALDILFRLDEGAMKYPPPDKKSGGGAQSSYTFKSGNTYEGQWENCKRHGYGVQRWTDGCCYEGQWEGDAASGRGRFTFANGDMYIGEWHSNAFDGVGVYYTRDGVTYRGEWDRDARHGHGVEETVAEKQMTRYSGLFFNNKKHDYGVYDWPGGGQYAGAFFKDAMSGYGEHKCGDSFFQGEWRKSKKNGFGLFQGPLRSYGGRYEDDVPVGLGCYSGTGADGQVIKSFRVAQ